MTFTVAPNVTSFSDTNLLEDTGYTYTVFAFNDAGRSTPSNTASATTLDSPPAAPQNLTATAITFQRIDLEWEPSEDADFYEVEQSTDGVAFVLISRPILTELMIFGLQPETTYFFRVRAVNSGGPSPYSNVASARTLRTTDPATPTDLVAAAVSGSQIKLSWRDNAWNERRLEVERSSGSGFRTVGRVRANVTTFSDGRLAKGTTYMYRVRACNLDGCSPYSNTASASTFSR